MNGLYLFTYWLILVFGFLWLKRTTSLIRCNVFSAAIASVVFLAITAGFEVARNDLLPTSDWVVALSTLFMALLLLPTAFYLTLRLGSWLLPSFQVEVADLKACTIRLTVWTYIGLLLLKLMTLPLVPVFLLLAGASAVGTIKTWNLIGGGHRDRYY